MSLISHILLFGSTNHANALSAALSRNLRPGRTLFSVLFAFKVLEFMMGIASILFVMRRGFNKYGRYFNCC